METAFPEAQKLATSGHIWGSVLGKEHGQRSFAALNPEGSPWVRLLQMI